MHWRERGFASNQSMLFIHGLSAWGEQFEPVIERLDQRWHCLAPDLPGFGWSPALTDHSFDLGEIADLLAAGLAQRDAAPARVVGHSMGAAVAVTLAERHPELVERLVLLAPAGLVRWDRPSHHRAALHGAARRTMLAAGMPLMHLPMGRRVLSRIVGDPERLSTRDARMLLRGASLGDQRTLDSARATLADAAIAERIASLPMPVELVWGTADRLVPITWADLLVSKRPGMHLTRVDGAGHVLTLERPELVAAALERASWAEPT